MAKLQTLPYIDFQPDALSVFDDVAQEVVNSEDVWVSCYREGETSAHGKIKLSKTGEGIQGVGMKARDGVEIERNTHTTFSVSSKRLKIPPTTVRFPRQTITPPQNDLSRAPLIINSLAISPSGSHIAYGGPDGYCYVQPTSSSSTSTGGGGDEQDKAAGKEGKEGLVRLKGHVGDVTDVKWFPSGEVVLTASTDSTLRLHSSLTSHSPRTLTGHKRAITSIHILGPGPGRNVLSASKDGTIRLWDVTAGRGVTTMGVERFMGVERVGVGVGARVIREEVGGREGSESESGEEKEYRQTELDGEIITDTADKIIFAGLTSSSSLLSAYDLSSKTPILPSFPHIPSNLLSAIPTSYQGGSVHAVAYEPERWLLASGSGKGVVIVRDTRMIDASGSGVVHIFRRNQAGINDISFIRSSSGGGDHTDLIIAPAAGLPFRARLGEPPGGNESEGGGVSVVEEYAGWEAVPINSVAVGVGGEGNVWVAGGEGGIRRY